MRLQCRMPYLSRQPPSSNSLFLWRWYRALAFSGRVLCSLICVRRLRICLGASRSLFAWVPALLGPARGTLPARYLHGSRPLWASPARYLLGSRPPWDTPGERLPLAICMGPARCGRPPLAICSRPGSLGTRLGSASRSLFAWVPAALGRAWGAPPARYLHGSRLLWPL